MFYYPGNTLTFSGFEMQVKRVTSVSFGELSFTQDGGKIAVSLPEAMADAFCPVLKFECDGIPSIYRTGGMRIPKCRHTRYDPAPPDIQY